MIRELQKRLLSFSAHHPPHLGQPFQHILGMVGDLRPAQPDFRIRQDFSELFYKLFHIDDIPQITGKTKYIRMQGVQIHQDLVHLLIDRIFCNLHTTPVFMPLLYCIGPQAVDCKIRMDIFCVDRCQ